MYLIGEYVIHNSGGICQIKEIMKMNLTGTQKEYYLLIPLGEKGSKIYTPVGSENGTVRTVITKEQAWKLIDEMKSIDELWIENDKEREMKYREAIKSCEPRELVKIIKALYSRKQRRLAEGKKNTVTDEKYFKRAEDNLYSELAFALNEKKENMRELIKEHME